MPEPTNASLITVVNGDNGNLTLLHAVLMTSGYRVMLHKDGTATYQTIKGTRPSLILLDIPVEHPAASWILLDLLTLDPDTSSIPVLVCCHEPAIVAQKQRMLNQTGNDVLEKPFTKGKLLARIEALLHP